MPKVNVLNIKGENVGELELNETLFNTEISEHAVYEVVKNQLANKRQGTQSARTRAEVRGGGRKPFRQKGTGRARQGSIRAPHYTGGGVVFAPKPRDYRMSIPKSMRKVAMTSALTSKVADMVVLEDLTFEAPKTKEAVKMLNAFEAKKTLIITAEVNENVYKSARNIEGVTVMPVNNINVYDLLNCKTLMITKEAVNKIEEVYA